LFHVLGWRLQRQWFALWVGIFRGIVRVLGGIGSLVRGVVLPFSLCSHCLCFIHFIFAFTDFARVHLGHLRSLVLLLAFTGFALTIYKRYVLYL